MSFLFFFSFAKPLLDFLTASFVGSAISFSVCVNNKYKRLEELVLVLRSKFNVEEIENVDLYTIRHFDKNASKFINSFKKPILLEQRTQETAQFLI